MLTDSLGDLLSHPFDRVKRCHRVLKDHGYLISPDLPHLVLFQLQQIHTL